MKNIINTSSFIKLQITFVEIILVINVFLKYLFLLFPTCNMHGLRSHNYIQRYCMVA